MGLSTDATCQPEKPESSQVKTWGSASTLGGELAPPRCLSSNRREHMGARACGMLGITAEKGKALLSTRRALEVGAETVWLPDFSTIKTLLQASSY